jgi:zinc transport system ATP-binding protein
VPDSRPVIDVQHVHFAYGAVPVLEDVELTVQRGEFLGLVGPNAGGKSTLLKLILGLLEPGAGRVLVLGQTPRRARRRLGYVPQYPPFARDFPISVGDVVLMGRLGLGPMLGGWRRSDREAAARALAEVEADDLAGRSIATLSGGQLQRVLLARLNERLTIVVVSHDIAFISTYVSRVACLNRTLVCHRTDDIDGQTITELYGEDVRMISHEHGHAHAHADAAHG